MFSNQCYSLLFLVLRCCLLQICLLCFQALSTSGLSGPHVCPKQETYVQIVNETYSAMIAMKTYTFCFSIPPKCSKFKIVPRTKYRSRNKLATRPRDVCCDGYEPTKDGERCQEVCSNRCIHGACQDTGKCLCEKDFIGVNCNRRLIVTPPHNLTVLEGKKASFACEVEANALKDLSVLWKKNNIPIYQIPWLHMRSMAHKNGTLVINQTSANDLGFFTCEVSNGIEGPLKASANGYLDVQYPAHVTYTPAQVFLPRNGRGIINCYIASNPPVTSVTWMKNQAVFSPNSEEDVFLLSNGSLLITKADEVHEGNYTCIPYNKHLTSGFYGITKVMVIDSIFFELKPRPMYVGEVGQEITLECSGKGGPNVIVTWKKQDGEDLPEDRVSFQAGNLTIKSLTKTDQGFYTCQVKNEMATIVTQTELLVKDFKRSEDCNLPCSSDTLKTAWKQYKSIMAAFSHPKSVFHRLLEDDLDKCLG